MIQQINLYQDQGASDKHPLLNAYLLSAIATIGGLLVASALTWQTLHEQQNHRRDLQQQLQQSSTQLLSLQANLPTPPNDALLLQELQQSQTLYQSLSQVVELLANDQSDQTRGFSRYLSALAGQADNNVWLNRISINAETADISLHGSSFKPDQIPLLLQRLQRAEAFKGRHFARLDIQQAPQNQEQVDFSISSSLIDVEDKNARHP